MAPELTPAAVAPVAVAGGWTVLAGAVAAAGIYEAIATALNTSLDAQVLPSCTTALQQVTVRRAVARTKPPKWARTGMVMGAGFAAYVFTQARAKSKVGPT